MDQGTSLSQGGQATAHQRNADKRAVAARVFKVTTSADGTDVARINRVFGHSEGQRDSARKR
jgi:hypothetical protein